VITMGRHWMSALVSWIPGLKHPATPKIIYMNCYEYDRVRRAITGRCKICNFVVTRDEKAVRELVFKCGDTSCDCQRTGLSRPHPVCHLCYDMFHALYANYTMVNRNYFKELDDQDKANSGDNPEKRRRMGL
jgi:hypothetical protein